MPSLARFVQVKALRKRDRRIPRRPLLWLAAALIFTLPPMLGTLATWVLILFLITLAAKFWMEPKGYRLRSTPWKLLLVSCILVAVFLTYGSIKAIEPGVSLVVILMSLKILEAHTAHEFQVMVLGAWILCLCGFFLTQDLATALCLLIAFSLLFVALIQFHRGPSADFWAPVRAAGRLLAQAVPLVVLLFLLFPRVSGGFRFQFSESRGASSGFSGTISPGSVAALANSSDIAFRAEFPDGEIPPLRAMYWRGAVLWQGDGLEWRSPDAPAASPHRPQYPPGAQGIRQRINLEPHNEHWMFALDWPSEPPAGAFLAPGNYLWSGKTIQKSKTYNVKSVLDIREKELHPRERKVLLEVPATISPSVRELAQSWSAPNRNPRAIVNAALRFFQTQGFRYSLSPGEYKKNDLEEFLFRRRIGFCEHYAAAFATLMRLAGVPARLVAGYLGGEYNEFGRFFLVRQADTHAWCEVWLPDSGWVRVDPTSVVAPDRVNLGLSSFLERRAASGQPEARQSALVRNLSQSPIFNDIRLAWQTLNYTWDTRVLSFDADVQESLFAAAGMSERGPLALVFHTIVIAAFLLGIYAAWMLWRTHLRRDRTKALYERFCRKAAGLGARRNPWEGPLDFSQRAAQLLPNESESIRRISEAYISLRYSPGSSRDAFATFAKEVSAFGRQNRGELMLAARFER
jgi:protein-glutamine gamma-glutamyltransferase